MTNPITQFVRNLLALRYKKKASQRKPDPNAEMPRGMRGRMR